MKKLLAVVSMAFVVAALGAGDAGAKDMTKMKSVGWYDQNAPIGGGIWLTDKVGIQAGVGLFNTDVEGADTRFSVTGAVPIVLAGSDRVNFMFRPGGFFESKPASGVDNFISIRGDLAVEVFLSDRFSVIGGHGVEYVRTKYDTSSFSKTGDLKPLADGSSDTTSDFQTREISSSSVGFMFYFPG